MTSGGGGAARAGVGGVGEGGDGHGRRRGHRIRIAVDPADRHLCDAVRKEVFVVEQRVPEDLEFDGLDDDAVQFLAVRDDGVAIGTGRLLYGPLVADRTGGDATVGVLGRLAVAREARGLGIGAALVRAIEEAARQAGLAEIDLHAQSYALGFYERLGYRAYGEEFLDVNIPHRAMRHVL